MSQFLRKAAEEVRRDWRQVLDAALNYATQFDDAKARGERVPRGLQTSLFKSFAVSTRSLTEFFYPRKGKSYPDDVRAEDFFASSERARWHDAVGCCPRVLRWYRRRANKHVCHITKVRLNVRKRGRFWRVNPVIESLEKTLRRFERETKAGGLFVFDLDPTQSACSVADPEIVPERHPIFSRKDFLDLTMGST